MYSYLIALATLYGLIFGSFVNAWAYRIAAGKKIGEGRSACPRCGAPIRAWDNVPVVSWLLLRGRCRDCGEPISWRYPVGEALMASLFAAVAALDGVSWLLLPHLLFVATLVIVSQVDLEIRIIPDVVILPAAVLGLPLMIVLGADPWWQWPVAAAGAAAFLFVVGEVYFRLRRTEGMGLGDVKLALCMGAYLGIAVVPALFIGFLAGAAAGVAIVIARRADARAAIPFGPFLAVGAVVALFFGDAIVSAYLGLLRAGG